MGVLKRDFKKLDKVAKKCISKLDKNTRSKLTKVLKDQESDDDSAKSKSRLKRMSTLTVTPSARRENSKSHSASPQPDPSSRSQFSNTESIRKANMSCRKGRMLSSRRQSKFNSAFSERSMRRRPTDLSISPRSNRKNSSTNRKK